MDAHATDTQRDWWECAPRSAWSQRIATEQPEIVKRQDRHTSNALITLELERLVADNGCPRRQRTQK